MTCHYTPSQMKNAPKPHHLANLFISPSVFIRLARHSLPSKQLMGLQPRRPTMTAVTRAVTPSGEAVAAANDDCYILERSTATQSGTATILLNRPKALNALTRDMCLSLYHRVRYFDQQTDTRCIILRSSEEGGRAFCAGGDVRTIYHAHREQGVYLAGDNMFRAEYRLVSLLAQLKHASVAAILDGITMGGGLGISIHGRWRVATERTVVAMPECILGLQPDVGVCFAFPRLPLPGLGAYLALTGARLHGQDAVRAGIATHFVLSQALDSLCTELERDGSNAEHALEKHSTQVSKRGLRHQSLIERCFVKDSVEQVISSLESIVRQGDDDDKEFAADALAKIRAGSPTAAKVVWDGLKRGATVNRFDDWMSLEFRLVTRMIRRDDFASGVRSALVTKDRTPTWRPATMGDVSEGDVQSFFAPLSEDLNIEEIDLDHESSYENGQTRPRL